MSCDNLLYFIFYIFRHSIIALLCPSVCISYSVKQELLVDRILLFCICIKTGSLSCILKDSFSVFKIFNEEDSFKKLYPTFL
ncbi:MAG: hypothetical protein HRT40_03915 [Campylobacteraceae bacterium]|nr:hypothetical protein [Campylobacteraceae bacterium]